MEQKAYRMVPRDTQLLQSQQWTEARRQGVQGHSRLHSKNLSSKPLRQQEETQTSFAIHACLHSSADAFLLETFFFCCFVCFFLSCLILFCSFPSNLLARCPGHQSLIDQEFHVFLLEAISTPSGRLSAPLKAHPLGTSFISIFKTSTACFNATVDF